MSGASGEDGGDGRDSGGQGRQDHSQGQSTAERAVAVLSVVVTLALLGFVAWQAWTVPPAENPTARVLDTRTLPDGSVEVTVEFVNDQDVGVTSATVEVDCDSPPPQVTFSNVPAGGRSTARVMCPPNATDPNASVVTWQEP